MSNLAIEYEQDFYLWLCHNVELLRQGRISETDIENIAEELDGMSKSQHRELLNRLKVLLAHLLKWQFEPEHRSGSWKRTVVEQRDQIEELLEISPSLKYQLYEKILKIYKRAVEYASAETGIPESKFPKICPYSLEQTLDNNFYPDEE